MLRHGVHQRRLSIHIDSYHTYGDSQKTSRENPLLPYQVEAISDSTRLLNQQLWHLNSA